MPWETLQILGAVNATLAARGWLPKPCTVADATLIAPLTSTNNSTGTRDPAMRYVRVSKQGNRGRRGMNAHPGPDADQGLLLGVAFDVARKRCAHRISRSKATSSL